LAFDGGQTCPFFSVAEAALADMMPPKKSRMVVMSGERDVGLIAENDILFQAVTKLFRTTNKLQWLVAPNHRT